ncbi:bifunctional precorrin-2 dehydrogenase/sirohydrochlorin ferrochelatase [Thalassotalea sp. Y01]|uniref:precorrin-2 dehydrogenase/sirohydrochlorin ferrochelatase family protein n=1 Tax=Thalassotalea sp. Y01 TaxID=2729613 RepID=UPI00145E3089|nr:bifunctional precorrin-2 dehydrogenase/sirohydrochlorin ferrochelatase [Thalassotalea sp. Y01]NMP17076.1 bifunctional precorrin-2 dehydrogenase/sirohydrochlorin ferrochelatase [Thalassotalea sp. Y01]
MNYFPIFLDGHKINALIIGGGNVAARKLELLVKTPATVTVLCPELESGCEHIINKHNVQHIKNVYHSDILQQPFSLVIAATNDKLVNKHIADDCLQRGILLNVVDTPDLCTYITPAIIDRDPMLVAISSSGNAPMLLQLLKQQIDQLLPADYGKLAAFMGNKRKQVQSQISDFAARRLLWQQVLTSDVCEAVFSDNSELAEQRFNELLNQQQQPQKQINLIKVNSDTPDDLSLKAYRALQSSDVVFIESQLTSTFADFCRKDAEKFTDFDAQLIAQYSNSNNVSLLIQEQHTYQALKQQFNVNLIYGGH